MRRSGGDPHPLDPRPGAAGDFDRGFRAAEFARDQRDQFRVGLAIHGRRFELRQPGAIVLLRERADARMGFGFDVQDAHAHRIACDVYRQKQTPGETGRLYHRNNGLTQLPVFSLPPLPRPPRTSCGR